MSIYDTHTFGRACWDKQLSDLSDDKISTKVRGKYRCLHGTWYNSVAHFQKPCSQRDKDPRMKHDLTPVVQNKCE